MRKFSFYFLLLILFAIPAGSIFYKTQVLNLPLLPLQAQDGWILQFELRPDRVSEETLRAFPIPESEAHQTVSPFKVRPDDLSHSVNRQEAGTLLEWKEKDTPPEVIQLGLRVKLKEVQLPQMRLQGSLGPLPPALESYRTPRVLSKEIEGQILQLEQSLLPGQSDEISKLRAIYYWITEEMPVNEDVKSLEQALLLSSASRLERAKLFTLLARRSGLPARTVAAVRLREPKKDGAAHQFLTYYNEVYYESAWYPVDVNRRRFGHRSPKHIILHQNWESLESTFAHQDKAFAVLAEPARTDQLDTISYVESLEEKKSLFTKFSFHKLPLSLQAMFYSILLLPFGAVVLSFARNMIGVQTFGIFTPILLTLFFLETSLEFGVIFFFLIVILGFIQRYVLDRFYLLAVPRLSILLTLVIITFAGVALLNNEYDFLSAGRFSLGYFPIVITTVFIERFSIYFIEEGTWNTLKTLAGTFLVAVFCYLLFQFQGMKLLIFTHPELLLVAVALCIMIGSYKGYRISEFFRFKDLSRL